MYRRVAPELAVHAVRLREIERELARLRREQRLFRRLGFGENIKAMQIVTLQVEQRECLAVLRPNASQWEQDARIVVTKKAVNVAVLVLGLLAGCFAAGTRSLVNRYQVRQARRLVLRPTAVVEPRPRAFGANAPIRQAAATATR